VRAGRSGEGEVVGNLGADATLLTRVAAIGNVHVEHDPPTVTRKTRQTENLCLSLEFVRTGHDVGVGSVETLTNLSSL